MNQITISGNATRDPKAFDNGVARFGVAVNGREKRDGEWKDRVDFFDVVCFGRLAEVVCQYVRKGNKVVVSGRIESHEYDGKTYWEIKARDVVGTINRPYGQQKPKPTPKAKPKPAPEPELDMDDDLPF